MLMVLEEAKEKFNFKLANFCIMPTHIHLLIIPGTAANLSQIMHWVKLRSSKRWNAIHGSSGHLWGSRFFERSVKGTADYLNVMQYIDKNPVKSGHTLCVGDWKASGAYHIRENIRGFVDYDDFIGLFYDGAFRYLALPAPKTAPMGSVGIPFASHHAAKIFLFPGIRHHFQPNR
jgi:REP element-mobilizing transposase RayT